MFAQVHVVTTPHGVVVICSACRRTVGHYVVPMLNHKQLASAGLIWCPQCYEGLKGRRYRSGHLGENLRPQKGGASLPLQKPGKSAASSGSLSGTKCDGTIFQSFPTLWEFLTLSAWPDGSSRKPGTLILFTEGEKWKMCLKDVANARVAFVTAEALDDLFLAADEGLDKDSVDWRPDRPQGGRGR